MEQIVVGVFKSKSEAERARNELSSAGFAASAMEVHAADSSRSTSSTAGNVDEAEEGGIAHFFRSLFGMKEHHESADLYADAVRRGNFVLTVHAVDAAQTERAQDILDECGAVDVEERSSQQNEVSALTSPRTEVTGDGARAGNVKVPSASGTPRSTKANIPVVEEELQVGKREVSRGGVRVFSRMSEKPVEKTVQLRDEHAKVERRPVDRPATEADLSAFKEGSIEVRETVEEAVVSKKARVVEEVNVSKETTQRQETVRDTLRHTDVQVDRLGSERTGASAGMSNAFGDNAADMDDTDFRAHWQSNYANSGGTYDEYAPAYGYGSELRSSGRYEGRTWDDMEPDARRDWETRHPDSTWERFKDSVRHGWEKVTGGTGSQSRTADRTGRHPAA